jgi:hypothetical protein
MVLMPKRGLQPSHQQAEQSPRSAVAQNLRRTSLRPNNLRAGKIHLGGMDAKDAFDTIVHDANQLGREAGTLRALPQSV